MTLRIENLLQDLLDIPSPTFNEIAFAKFCSNWVKENIPVAKVEIIDDSVIVQFDKQKDKKHISFVGHSDVVPAHFSSYIKGDLLYGSGASDMKAAVAVYLKFLKENYKELLKRYNVSFILYSREEGTTLEENGLASLFKLRQKFLKSIDLAIIGEPTDNSIQIGCVGSMHYKIRIDGVSCHSARPWNGENALYKALPFIQEISKIQPKAHSIFGVDFYDVIQITESHSEKGRTSLPGYWECNVNFRFSPTYSEQSAKEHIERYFKNIGLKMTEYALIDSAPSGSVIESSLFTKIIDQLGGNIEAKQAWTDVAQFSMNNIPAFNFGPGLTAQAHKVDEYVSISGIKKYENKLKRILED